MLENDAKPWDLFNGSPRASQDFAETRFKICEACEFLRPLSQTCKHCNCVMKVKTKVAHASCPIGKWGKEEKS